MEVSLDKPDVVIDGPTVRTRLTQLSQRPNHVAGIKTFPIAVPCAEVIRQLRWAWIIRSLMQDAPAHATLLVLHNADQTEPVHASHSLLGDPVVQLTVG